MFWERFFNLCEECDIKPNPLGKKLGISSGSFTKWKNGSNPSGDSLIKLADYFNCSADYLLGRTDNRTSPSDNGICLTDSEENLIITYRSMNEEGQDFLMKTAEFAKSQYKKCSERSVAAKIS
ncbi:MAG: helix-turn-helix transcriptional regulator [Clostridiales bacterium]|nr:helix-turn-helix transcriptional regulator [Clostridiales bacterium]